MKKHALIFSLALSGLFLWGCYPGGVEYVDDMDVVVTYHNADYDFAAKTGTYAMPDKIVKITGNKIEGELPEFMLDIYAAPILTAIAKNMDDLGWTRVETTDSAVIAGVDLILLPSAITSTTLVYYYDYWSYWYGGYYPYYGGGYTTSYTTGTLLMTLFDPDPNEADFGGNPVTQWTGAANGLLTGYGNVSRVTDAINQAFTQSPYLKTN